MRYRLPIFILAVFVSAELTHSNVSAQPIVRASQPVQSLEDKVRELVDLRVKKGEAKNISVFFEDLSTRGVFGIRDDELYNAASLLKVPLMMAVLKKAETDSSFLARRVEFHDSGCGQRNFRQTIVSTVALQDGQSYSVEELLYRLIVHSDNAAICPLDALISQDEFKAVLLQAKIPISNMGADSAKISARQYGELLRMLYRATYLSPEMSLRALRLLSRAEFHEGLVAGVAENVMVSHKFGEWGATGESEFHDCGIVYSGKRPYLLCLMTRGKKIEHLIPSIADLSRVVFKAHSS